VVVKVAEVFILCCQDRMKWEGALQKLQKCSGNIDRQAQTSRSWPPGKTPSGMP
jgi:hypothetical protein